MESKIENTSDRWVAWWFASTVADLGFFVLGFSDRLSGGKYRDDLSCERWYAEFVWRVGNRIYELGCDLYGRLLSEEN